MNEQQSQRKMILVVDDEPNIVKYLDALLRDNGYDLAPVWRSAAMEELRGSIKRKECACPMANASYANMLLHPPTVAKVMLDVAKS